MFSKQVLLTFTKSYSFSSFSNWYKHFSLLNTIPFTYISTLINAFYIKNIRIYGKTKNEHLPHDSRHTFSSLMDSAGTKDVCIKLIIGHIMKNDTTKGTYTHKTLEKLLTKVTKI